jgi:hypothetical protein
MNIAWNSIGLVAVITLGTIIVLAVCFGLGTLSVSRYQKARADGGSATLGAAGAGAAFVICLAIAVFGLYLTVKR